MRHAAPGSPQTQAGQAGQAGRRQGGRRRAGRRRGRGKLPSAAVEGTREPAQPARFEQLPYWLIVAGACASIATIRLGTHDLKSGTLVLAGVLLIAALARLVLPDRRAGLLSSRRRWFDVVIFAAFGIGLLAAGLGVQAPVG
ncbi:MAG TPA: DUF3017 domain-containing protein [Streptosporangiaceae bacterium]|nr:DUF3017 domain-containing protein [Streptosporangiaceae bacterium]